MSNTLESLQQVLVWSTFGLTIVTFLLVLVTAALAFLNFRQVEFQFRPKFDARLEWVEEGLQKNLFIVFENRSDIPLKVDIYICASVRAAESEYAEIPEAKFLKSRKLLPSEVRERTKLPTLGHLVDDLYSEGHRGSWYAGPEIERFIREHNINQELYPWLQVRFDGQFWATVTRWPFKTKWPYVRLYMIQWLEREKRWLVAPDEFVD